MHAVFVLVLPYWILYKCINVIKFADLTMAREKNYNKHVISKRPNKQHHTTLTLQSFATCSYALFLLLFKGTPLRSGHVIHSKRTFSKTYSFLLLTCVGHRRLYCSTLMCLLLVDNSFKTCIISFPWSTDTFHV